MYGLPQIGILAQTILEKRLHAHGYHQSRFTPGLWTHKWRPNFGVKYVGKEHADNLIKCIKEKYDITEDWEGKRYLVLTFDWNHDTCSIHLSIPNYIPDAIKRFKRKKPNKWQVSPHQRTVPNYGAKQQFSKA